MKKFIFFIAIGFLPFLLFIVFEFSLRFFKIGIADDPFTEVPGTSYLVSNVQYPQIFNKYSDETVTTQSLKSELFNRTSPEGVLRGFLLGESTPQGFPYFPNNSFGKMTQEALNYSSPNIKWEIINASASAMTSYYVRETAQKLLKYDPKFLILYVGHNEFYGTISQSSSPFHSARLLYIWLNQYRSFQLIFKALSFNSQDSTTGTTLMEKQFNSRKFPDDEQMNSKAYLDYWDNIQFVINLYSDKNIPVILFNPVANYISMPPFDSVKGDVNPSDVDVLYKSLLSNDKFKAQAALLQLNESTGSSKNAVVQYLSAFYKAKTDVINLNNFIKAQDLDAIPFRMKSYFKEQLKNSNTEWNINHLKPTTFIDLDDIFQKKVGDWYFSNKYFVDHVHFNWAGHAEVSKILSQILQKEFPDVVDPIKLAYINDDIQNYLPLAHCNPAFEIIALNSLMRLFQRPPFSSMQVPYGYPELMTQISKNILIQDEDLKKSLESVKSEDILNTIAKYLYDKGRLQEYKQLIEDMIFINPGSSLGYDLLANFLTTHSDDLETIEILRVQAKKLKVN